MHAGLPQVVAMQGNVTDGYAIELAGHFYRELADAADRQPAAALADARRALEAERQTGRFARSRRAAGVLDGDAVLQRPAAAGARRGRTRTPGRPTGDGGRGPGAAAGS